MFIIKHKPHPNTRSGRSLLSAIWNLLYLFGLLQNRCTTTTPTPSTTSTNAILLRDLRRLATARDCGRTAAQSRRPRASEVEQRIVGGREATLYEFPWQVAIKLKRDSLTSAPFCGGTLLGSKWVITAAHCVFTERNDPGSLVIYAGSNNPTNRSSAIRTVSKVFVPKSCKFHSRVQHEYMRGGNRECCQL